MASQHSPGAVPGPTQDFHIFVQRYPHLATRATEYDEMARSLLKGKYTAFAQGTYAVIEHRTGQNAVATHQAGVRDPTTRDSGPAKYLCPPCNQYYGNIKDHLETHNQHPGKSLYCPVCLERISRNDTVTLPEHVLGSHPDTIFGPTPHPLQTSERILKITNTTEKHILVRLSNDILYRYIECHQLHLSQVLQGLSLSSVQELDEKHGLRTDHNIDVSELFSALDKICAGPDASRQELCAANGLLTSEHVQATSRDHAMAYLKGLRVCISDLMARVVEEYE